MNGIPSQFMLAGRTVQVKQRDDLYGEYEEYGQWLSDKGTILLQRSLAALPISADRLEENFWHEAVHGILEASGYATLSEDEKLVSLVAGFVHQLLKTARFEDV